MKLVVQRVTHASVEVNNEVVGEIGNGLMVLVGFGVNDTKNEADYLSRKLVKLRIFQDENGRMNKSVKDIGGKLLLIPQFTLYASNKKNRPSFHKALTPDIATKLFDYFASKCSEEVDVETGEFGAYMKVDLLNNGPVTILLEKEADE
ncbi:D-tyrosyl-tRNA(Tyr) deacylase [Methanobrevibacter gottschalkii]|uniref:D-aminoacyl-tRNA deacylase n=2 Tax=Methanobrevibacter gottschalkii TaxID=190974 RepID=A0A3N5B1E9_9EURY|nr:MULTISPECIES: D-aminoacyl-tRNA deacylase [Methanobrevibacter]MCQ2970557.1 D-aminoacyl-tRNA deacylase [archaeon]OED01703.1 D-tyrosyl-tRNA(Tyr) deacylase [Methanobrevibacter sp. A27]RPF50979.1 D-tyrosyl-tRNA(Tyr) deacylase [Methanobrevibacter gottschalkii DSM 11977]SEL08650.1 D-tyrosyl-tRNA(Tyr) deacylase [Methanobrevibacter gottschalkii]